MYRFVKTSPDSPRSRQKRDETRDEFVAYGTPTSELPDPVARAIGGLVDQIDKLSARINELENKTQLPDAVATNHVEGEGADDDRVTKLPIRTRG